MVGNYSYKNNGFILLWLNLDFIYFIYEPYVIKTRIQCQVLGREKNSEGILYFFNAGESAFGVVGFYSFCPAGLISNAFCVFVRLLG